MNNTVANDVWQCSSKILFSPVHVHQISVVLKYQISVPILQLNLFFHKIPAIVAMRIRVRPRFFDQVGHETMYASSGNKHFFTKSCHHASDLPKI